MNDWLQGFTTAMLLSFLIDCAAALIRETWKRKGKRLVTTEIPKPREIHVGDPVSVVGTVAACDEQYLACVKFDGVFGTETALVPRHVVRPYLLNLEPSVN